MNKNKVKLICISLFLVLVINVSFVVTVAFCCEKEVPVTVTNASFLSILQNKNDTIQLDDYCLLNWSYSKEGCKVATYLPETVLNAKFVRCGKTESVIVQLLQTKFNSKIQVYSIDLYSEERDGSAGNAEFVKILNDYYLICGYTYTENDSLEHGNAVFKTDYDISDIESLVTEKQSFYSYHFYPSELSMYSTTPLYKIANISILILEFMLVFFVLRSRLNKNQSKNKTGSGSMSRPKQS